MQLKKKQRPRIKIPISKLFIAYTAGFFDGEGCLHKHGERGHFRIHLAQASKEPLLTFKKKFGIGKVSKRNFKLQEHHKDIWQWQFGRQADVYRFLLAIYPFLYVKKEQVKQAIKELSEVLPKEMKY